MRCSYVYDAETGLYYLQSRYYNPELGRFINADAFTSTGQGLLGNDAFAYCLNNPVKHKDSQGFFTESCYDEILDLENPEDLAGVSFAYAYNPIDAGYQYGVDFTMQSNSSLWTGGIYRLGYTFYGYTAEPGIGSSTAMPSLCFVAGTLVQGENQAVPIEEIRVGDMVWAWDESTGQVALKEVVETYINETNELVHVFVNGEEIVTTPAHPFYSPIKGWTAASKLRAGDILVTVNGEYVVVEKVQHEILEDPITVYNFQVEGYHTYYVANEGVLVHNACNERGVAGKGWQGDQTWRKNVSIVQSGGTITELIGGIPTRYQGELLISQAKGTDLRVEHGHDFPNPHVYPHINYMVGNKKGTLRITSVEYGE